MMKHFFLYTLLLFVSATLPHNGMEQEHTDISEEQKNFLIPKKVQKLLTKENLKKVGYGAYRATYELTPYGLALLCIWMSNELNNFPTCEGPEATIKRVQTCSDILNFAGYGTLWGKGIGDAFRLSFWIKNCDE